MLLLKHIGILRIRLIDVLRGTNIFGTLKLLRRHQYIPRKELDKYCQKKFQALFEKAKRSTRYYASYNSYEELPILTKQAIRNNFSDFFSKDNKKKLFAKATGGSTGTPLIYYTTNEAQSYMWAGIILSWEIAGYKIGDKVAFIAGSSIIKSTLRHKLFYKLLNIKVYSAFSLNEESIKQYIEEINNTGARIIYGYANAIGIIATYINKAGPISFPDLKGIVSTAEVLTELTRKNIEKAFKVKVYNQYAVNEAGISAFECEHQKMHLISTRCKYEIDNNGNLLSTDLTNEGFILMKYKTGDIVEFSNNRECSCKRTFPLIKEVVGRSNDIVIDSNNRVLHSEFFGHVFRKDGSIKQYQILFDRETITINLSVDANTSKQICDYNQYLDVVKKHLQFKSYKLILNAPFLQAENAKHRFIINNCK